MSDPSALANRIAELVTAHWNEHGRPLLLSQLGSADQGEVGKSAKELSTNLAEFIRNHAADRIRILSGSAYPLVMAAMPVDTEQEGDVDALLARMRERPGTRGPRYHPAFWAAFRVPLEDGCRRFMTACSPLRFEDVASTESMPEGYVEVERQYVADAGADASDVGRQVAEWLAANGLSRESFLAHKQPSDRLPPNDLLGRLLAALDPDDLRRMNIPLDVVAKLRRQPIP